MRRKLAPLLLVALVATAGCSSILGPPSVDYDGLSKEADYEWDAGVDAYLELNKGNYTAVYNVSAKTTGGNSTIEVYDRNALGSDTPLSVAALQFRYRNGTVLRFDGETVVKEYPNGTTERLPEFDQIAVEKTRKRTVVTVPTTNGSLAFTAPKDGKRVATPTFVTGSYEMVLPKNAEVSVPLLASIRPSATATPVEDGRVHVQWDDVQARSVSVRYYLHRDLLLFGALAVGLGIAGLVGGAYYLREIRKTRRRREEVGLDVDVEDDDREGPPPGMR